MEAMLIIALITAMIAMAGIYATSYLDKTVPDRNSSAFYTVQHAILVASVRYDDPLAHWKDFLPKGAWRHTLCGENETIDDCWYAEYVTQNEDGSYTHSDNPTELVKLTMLADGTVVQTWIIHIYINVTPEADLTSAKFIGVGQATVAESYPVRDGNLKDYYDDDIH